MKQKSSIYIYGDGGSRGNPGPSASAIIVYKGDQEIYRASRYLGKTTNNVAEYNCVLMGLAWLANNKEDFSKKIVFRLDSELVIKQILGDYKIKSAKLRPLYNRVNHLLKRLDCQIKFESVLRDKNEAADKLVNEELDKNRNKF